MSNVNSRDSDIYDLTKWLLVKVNAYVCERHPLMMIDKLSEEAYLKISTTQENKGGMFTQQSTKPDRIYY